MPGTRFGKDRNAKRYLNRRFSRESWPIGRAAHQLHSPLDFRPHQAKGPLNSGLAGRRERKEIEAPDTNGLGPERKRLQHMRSALDPSIHDHVDPIADGIHDFGQLVERGPRAVQLPAAMVGQHDAGAADLDCAFRVRHRHDALQAELAVPELDHFGHVVPVHGRVQHLGKIPADRHGPAAHVDVLVQLGQLEALMREVVDAPHRLDRELQHSAKRQPERNRKPGTQVAFAVAAGDAVHGQHHDLDAGLLGALHHGAVETAILVKIELIDLRRLVRLAQLLQADRAERGHAEHRAVLRCGGRDGAFALMVEQALQRSGRAIDRHRQLLAHDGHRHIDGFHAAQDVGHEVAALEARRIPAIGHLVVCRSVDVVEDRTRQPPSGQSPEIMEVVTVAQTHTTPASAQSAPSLNSGDQLALLFNAAFTRSGVNGTVRSRTPVASNTALASAAPTGAHAASPAPSGGSFGRSTSSMSSLGHVGESSGSDSSPSRRSSRASGRTSPPPSAPG